MSDRTMRGGYHRRGGVSMLDLRLALVDPEGLRIPTCVATADEAIALVQDLHAQWQAALTSA